MQTWGAFTLTISFSTAGAHLAYNPSGKWLPVFFFLFFLVLTKAELFQSLTSLLHFSDPEVGPALQSEQSHSSLLVLVLFLENKQNLACRTQFKQRGLH